VTIDQLGYGSICVNYNYVSEMAHTKLCLWLWGTGFI